MRYFILYDMLHPFMIVTSLFMCTGAPPVLVWFKPWKTIVRLDIFHFMRRFTAGLTTEHQPTSAPVNLPSTAKGELVGLRRHTA